MKRFVSALALCTLLLINVSATRLEAGSSLVGRGLQRAVELFIPIACNVKGEKHLIGTGFPVDKHMVMSAGHVDCVDAYNDPATETFISFDKGLTWQLVPEEAMFVSNQIDGRVYYLPKLTLDKPAQFRDAKLGEQTTGYGVAQGGLATLGHVMQVSEYVVSSQTVAGGMSGSALVADDGKVLGMTVGASPLMVGPDVASAWVTLAIPSSILSAQLKLLKEALPKLLALQKQLSNQ